MGVLDQLGYEVRPPNAAQRASQRVASTRPGAWTLQKTLYPFDKALFRWTDGRTTFASVIAGLPVVILTTTGAKTGQRRATPLVGVPLDDGLAVIGSNYGQPNTPGWVFNLDADPAATVSYRDATVPVVARRLDDDDSERVFELAAHMYGGYAKYRDRAGRAIKVFALDPID